MDGKYKKGLTFKVSIVLFLVTIGMSYPNGYFNVTDFGAIGNGTEPDTRAIQQTIDRCAERGGTIYFPPGTYLSGTLFLRSNVALYLDHGAILLGSTRLEDYPVQISEYRSYTDNYVVRSLIYAEKEHHIAIHGSGIIDGQGAAFKDRRTADNPYKDRPYLIRMIECRDVQIRDITLVNSPMWVQHYLACDDLLIDGISVQSHVAGNNDGIDIDACHRVRIANCSVSSGDDAIVLKSTSDRPCKDVVITNCILSSDCNAFKLGTESNGGFERIVFSNCTIYDTRMTGIALEIVDGGMMQDVNVNNIVIDNAGTAIFIRLGNRGRPYLSRSSLRSSQTEPVIEKEPLKVGILERVRLHSIIADGIGPTGCCITGLPGYPIEDIGLENIRITTRGGGEQRPISDVPEHEKKYPEFNMFGPLPAYGFYIRHVKDLYIDRMQLSSDSPDARPALVFDNVADLEISRFTASMNDTTAMIYLRDVDGAFVHGIRLVEDTFAVLNVENSEDITIMNNDLKRVKNVVIPATAISEQSKKGNILPGE